MRWLPGSEIELLGRSFASILRQKRLDLNYFKKKSRNIPYYIGVILLFFLLLPPNSFEYAEKPCNSRVTCQGKND